MNPWELRGHFALGKGKHLPFVQSHCHDGTLLVHAVFLVNSPKNHTNTGFFAVGEIGYPLAMSTSAPASREKRSGHLLINRGVMPEHIPAAHPLFWGRRLYVSLIRTSHGGTHCHCSYPASRSLCCLPLGNSQREASPAMHSVLSRSRKSVDGTGKQIRRGLFSRRAVLISALVLVVSRCFAFCFLIQ